MSRWILALTLVLTLGLVGPAAADDQNLKLFNAVSQAVQRYPYFTIFDAVHASIDNGVVTLDGKVTQPWKASDIEKRVTKLEGVRAVRSRLEVLPVSQFDNQLRLRLARAIYGNAALQMYGLGANPSIHIIVERGHVTLDGVVLNDMDRQIARAAVGQFGAFSITNDLKTEKEVEQDLERL